ncbi:MAG: 2-oxoacid:acceptor oxidoreductase subunit alpha [Syntrophomonas sp.]
MREISVLVGGVTGDGINDAGALIGRLFNRLGYRIYMYNDFPSLVKGGHNFVIVRAADTYIAAHSDRVDAIIAMNQDAIDLHENRLTAKTLLIYDKENCNVQKLSQPTFDVPVSQLAGGDNVPAPLKNICMICVLGKMVGVKWGLLADLLEKHSPQDLGRKLEIGRRAYDLAGHHFNLAKLNQPGVPVLSGSQAISLGLLKAGLQAYVAYPMTPTSPILEYLASVAPDFGLQVVPPESEIAVMLMALGYAYMGKKTAVGTSGGGFSLMVEGLGLAGQAELPVVVVMGQRAGPSTGMPTYTAQTDLHFVLNASQGEFPRFIAAPGDANEAYYWSGVALNIAWKYQMPAFVLSDKTLGLGMFSFDSGIVEELKEEQPALWDGTGRYRRYQLNGNGISPMAFPPLPGQVVKINSYVHDEDGITSEEPSIAKGGTDKRFLKERRLAEELEAYETVKVYGQGKTALLCWGTNKGVCMETAARFNVKVIQVVVLSPFPQETLTEAMEGVEKVISVECNALGQLAILLRQHGFHVDETILKYDGRPFSLEDLESQVKKVMA